MAPLANRISSPPPPLTIEEHIDNPAPGTISSPTSPQPLEVAHPPIPEGYAHYDPADPNHAKYARKMHLYQGPEDTPWLPHFVHFVHNLGLNQHYVLGLHDDSIPSTSPYGWALEAAPFIGPFLFPVYVDNEALGIFDTCYNKSRQVDAALYTIWDYGILADMDKYKSHMLDYKDIVACCNKVKKDMQEWHAKMLGIWQSPPVWLVLVSNVV